MLPIFTLTLQPVCCWNGVTQSTDLSLLPFSAYPAQAMMLSWPSPAPTLVAAARLGGAGAPPDEPPAEPDVESDPHAATSSATAATPTPATLNLAMPPPLLR